MDLRRLSGLLICLSACRSLPSHGVELTYALADRSAAEKMVSVLERRLASFDLRGATVTLAEGELTVRLPGVSDAARLRAVLEREGRLELAVVDDEGSALLAAHAAATGVEQVADPPAPLPSGVTLAQETVQERQGVFLVADGRPALEAAVALVTPRLPAQRALRLGVDVNDARRWRTYLVETPPWAMGERVVEVSPGESEWGGWHVSLGLDEQGRAEFAALTTRSVSRRIAILVDDEVLSAPVVMEPITGGRAMITLGAAADRATQRAQAEQLAFVLRGGALPAVLAFVRAVQYGPPR